MSGAVCWPKTVGFIELKETPKRIFPDQEPLGERDDKGTPEKAKRKQPAKHLGGASVLLGGR